MRQTEACDRCDRHEISMPAPSAQATARLDRRDVADDGNGTVAGTIGERGARPAHPLVERRQRLAAFGHERRVLAPPLPRL